MALILLGIQGSDRLDWVRFGQARAALAWLWLVALALGVSAATDGAIAYDFWSTRGANTQNIAGGATAVGLIASLVLMVGLALWRAKPETQEQTAEAAALFEAIENSILKERLYLDPDINLGRIARRLKLPVRDVSRTINGATGENVSQYINGLRIKEACRLLRDTDQRITEIVFAAGFNTKSNFNREFVRVTGKTPSEWRKAAAL